MLLFLVEHWPWFTLAHWVGVSCALALCRAAKRGDQTWERALLAPYASEDREARAPGSPA